MPRKKMCRVIASRPGSRFYKPRGIPLSELEVTTLDIDEYEALRLADMEGLYQSEAAEHMGVSRQTFALIVKSARSKVARALFMGNALEIAADPGDMSSIKLTQ